MYTCFIYFLHSYIHVGLQWVAPGMSVSDGSPMKHVKASVSYQTSRSPIRHVGLWWVSNQACKYIRWVSDINNIFFDSKIKQKISVSYFREEHEVTFRIKPTININRGSMARPFGWFVGCSSTKGTLGNIDNITYARIVELKLGKKGWFVAAQLKDHWET